VGRLQEWESSRPATGFTGPTTTVSLAVVSLRVPRLVGKQGLDFH